MIPGITGKSIIICSIVRNAANGLKHNVPVIKKLCSYFTSYDVVIYENDSVDDTKSILKEWHLSDPLNIHIICENLNNGNTIPTQEETSANPFFSARRIKKMVMLRNKYMEFIEDNNLVADYIMIVDLDVDKLFIKGIIDSFKAYSDWDIITAYGYSRDSKLHIRYHDSYALSMCNSEDATQTESFIYSSTVKLAHTLKYHIGLFPVDSAFGGLAIYKYDAIKGLRYHLVQNIDPRVEVRCEHYSLNRQASDRGFSRIYINPAMKLKYQSVTIRLVALRIKSIITSFFNRSISLFKCKSSVIPPSSTS